MAFQNTFKWSHSRQKNFDECKRKFYLNSYAIWGTNGIGGWDWRADDFTKLVYRLSKLQNLYTWAGMVVHDEISGILEKIRQGKTPEEAGENLAERVTARLQSNYRQSLDEKAWLKSPKRNMRLFEIHYEVEVTQDQADELKANILTCLENFTASDTFKLISSQGPEVWKPIEEYASFELNGFEVCLKLDFAMEVITLPPAERNQVLICDWKTGKWQAEEHIDQMAVYSLYAVHKWGYPPEDVTVRLVYLRDNQDANYNFLEGELKESVERIQESCLEIRSCLRDPKKNLAHIDDFPMTEDRWKCRRCEFCEVCHETRILEEVA